MATRVVEERVQERVQGVRVHGVYTGLGVVVPRREEWELLYREGSYGKGSFSRGRPEYGEAKLPREVPGLNTKEYLSLLKRTSDSWYHRVAQRDRLESERERVACLDEREKAEEIQKRSEEVASELASTRVSQPEGAIPMPGSGRTARVQEDLPTMNKSAILNATSKLTSSIDKKHSEAQEKFEIREVLHLSNEEAFYLAFEEKALTVVDRMNREVSVEDLWTEFCGQQVRFPFFYGAYVHFKRKGWTPKRGTKFGVDFLLYNAGPDFSHSEYGVLLQIEDSAVPQSQEGAAYGWIDFARTNRVLESVIKSTLLCYVSRKESAVDKEEPVYVNILEKLEISEFVLNRWKYDTAKDDTREEV